MVAVVGIDQASVSEKNAVIITIRIIPVHLKLTK